MRLRGSDERHRDASRTFLPLPPVQKDASTPAARRPRVARRRDRRDGRHHRRDALRRRSDRAVPLIPAIGCRVHERLLANGGSGCGAGDDDGARQNVTHDGSGGECALARSRVFPAHIGGTRHAKARVRRGGAHHAPAFAPVCFGDCVRTARTPSRSCTTLPRFGRPVRARFFTSGGGPEEGRWYRRRIESTLVGNLDDANARSTWGRVPVALQPAE